jgi:TonB family protein
MKTEGVGRIERRWVANLVVLLAGCLSVGTTQAAERISSRYGVVSAAAASEGNFVISLDDRPLTQVPAAEVSLHRVTLRPATQPDASSAIYERSLFSGGKVSRQAAYRPLLLPGCALPSAKLIAAAGPLDVELQLAVAASGAVVAVATSRSSGHPELDAAFAAAARACRFAPVPQAGLEGRQSVEHTLAYRYLGGPPPLGMHACFPTDYPSRARLREEEGTNGISFRVPAGDADAEIRLTRRSGSGSLDAEALLRARTCLANSGVRAELMPDQWYHQDIVWVLQ